VPAFVVDEDDLVRGPSVLCDVIGVVAAFMVRCCVQGSFSVWTKFTVAPVREVDTRGKRN
jgi:hypothetical protein